MRELREHLLNNKDVDVLFIHVIDEPAFGGMNHVYEIASSNSVFADTIDMVRFQYGPVKEQGVNGISDVALLAVLIDRLRSFQASPFACEENGQTLMHLEEAMNWQNFRRQNRIDQGVQGTSKVHEWIPPTDEPTENELDGSKTLELSDQMRTIPIDDGMRKEFKDPESAMKEAGAEETAQILRDTGVKPIKDF